MSGAANRRNQKDLAQRMGKYQGMHDEAKHGNVFDDASTQSALTQAREGLRTATRAGQSNAIRGGVTPQAQAATQQAAGRNYGDVVSQALRAGQARKDMLQSRYLAMVQGLEGQQHGMQMQDAQKWQTFMGNTGQLAGSLAQYMNLPKAP